MTDTITFADIQQYYRPHELPMSPHQQQVACNVVQLCRAGWTNRVRLNVALARNLGTSLRTLGRVMPESWYLWDDATFIVIPADIVATSPTWQAMTQ